MSQLPSHFVPADSEATLYQKWLTAGYFEARANSEKPPFTIVIPPPNVTGSLHIGHALDHTLQDTLSRRRRMQGFEVLWLPGMDHAGIATQNVVERQLAALGQSRHDLGREEFVAKVWQWKHESGGAILGQMKRLGDSVDWSRERFTMDDQLSRAVLTIFKRLFDADLIYRAERIINWCPRCLTALSDIEVEHQDDEGELVSIKYGEGENSIVVATTRAETMLGDTAVAVHPNDDRYQHLIGTQIELPLTHRLIPIIADEHVDPEFGTGAVKVTPAHDPNDFEIGLRHGLENLVIMDVDGKIHATQTRFDGLDRFEARSQVVSALKSENRIVAEKRPYVHAVGHCQRCDTTVEPRLSKQWFVRVAPLAKAAGDAVRDGRVKIEPSEMSPRYFEWVDNMHDWCISRQLWWGHRIPVWYGPNGEIHVIGPDEAAPDGWVQDEDVLDTWFSSALWPFSTLGWPDQTEDLKKFYPTSVLVTGYDILFFWVARMMIMGLFAMDGKQPFDVIALHGLVRDKYGKKMSKSRGNTIDPIEFMDKYGSDALRFSLARGANPGADLALAEEWVAGSRNFVTKLWNATRFAMMNGAHTRGELPVDLDVCEGWILHRLSEVAVEADEYFEKYEFAKACEVLYHFAWNDVCDWYLELSKHSLLDETKSDGIRRVIGEVLDVLLRLLHPVMPFVTEELWCSLTGEESLVIANWPLGQGQFIKNPFAVDQITRVQALVGEIRRFRSDQGVATSKKIPATLSGLGDAEALVGHIRSLARLTEPESGFVSSAQLEFDGVTIDIDLHGTVDIAAETARLNKDLNTVEKEIADAEGKLENADFVNKAPGAVVEKIKNRLTSAQQDKERIIRQLADLKNG